MPVNTSVTQPTNGIGPLVGFQVGVDVGVEVVASIVSDAALVLVFKHCGGVPTS